MAKNCKKFLHLQKLSPFFAPYGDHYDPPLEGSLGGDGSHMECYYKLQGAFYAFYW